MKLKRFDPFHVLLVDSSGRAPHGGPIADFQFLYIK